MSSFAPVLDRRRQRGRGLRTVSGLDHRWHRKAAWQECCHLVLVRRHANPWTQAPKAVTERPFGRHPFTGYRVKSLPRGLYLSTRPIYATSRRSARALRRRPSIRSAADRHGCWSGFNGRASPSEQAQFAGSAFQSVLFVRTKQIIRFAKQCIQHAWTRVSSADLARDVTGRILAPIDRPPLLFHRRAQFATNVRLAVVERFWREISGLECFNASSTPRTADSVTSWR